MMKVAVIGVGHWGIKHVDEYIQLGYNVIICDKSKENINNCKDRFDTVEAKNLETILNDKEITCVSICTPNHTHCDVASKCLMAKKHVFLEKPIATNIDDAEKLIKLSKKNNLILQIGHVYRFNNSVKKAKEIVNNCELGNIYSVNFSWTNFEPTFDDIGIILDLGIHPVDIIDNIFGGNYDNIKSRGWGFRQKNTEFAIINYRLITSENQSIFVNIELSWLNPIRKREMVVIGSKKTLQVDCVNQKIFLIDNISKNKKEIPITPNNTIRDELEYFINSSEKNQSISLPYPNGSIAKHILEIVLNAEIENFDKR